MVLGISEHGMQSVDLFLFVCQFPLVYSCVHMYLYCTCTHVKMSVLFKMSFEVRNHCYVLTTELVPNLMLEISYNWSFVLLHKAGDICYVYLVPLQLLSWSFASAMFIISANISVCIFSSFILVKYIPVKLCKINVIYCKQALLLFDPVTIWYSRFSVLSYIISSDHSANYCFRKRWMYFPYLKRCTVHACYLHIGFTFYHAMYRSCIVLCHVGKPFCSIWFPYFALLNKHSLFSWNSIFVLVSLVQFSACNFDY
jgi:hypothetical protein